MISGGEVGGRLFFVAAILGSPALWATAREAARAGRMDIAVARARRALKRAFSGRLRFSLDGRPEIKAEALTLMCPLVSTALDAEERALEAAALDPSSALDVFRLGFNAARGQWREDPSVNAGRCRTGKVGPTAASRRSWTASRRAWIPRSRSASAPRPSARWSRPTRRPLK
jgi:diacylglycerol kinase family enzyme